MTLPTYAIERARTEPPYTASTITCTVLGPNAHKLLHYALGLATEAIELTVAIKTSKPIAAQLEEMGDICWFAAGACDVLGAWPTDEQIAQAPKTGAFEVIAMCEEFASRIKSALFYGQIVKPQDVGDMYWKTLPAKILARTLAIANAQTTLGRNALLATNIQKLKVRYPHKFNVTDAMNRNPAAELAHLASIGNVALESEKVAPVDKAPIAPVPANREVTVNPNIKVSAPERKDFVLVSDKELKTILAIPETMRPRTLSGILGRQPTQGHENGTLPTEQPAPGLPPAEALPDEGAPGSDT